MLISLRYCHDEIALFSWIFHSFVKERRSVFCMGERVGVCESSKGEDRGLLLPLVEVYKGQQMIVGGEDGAEKRCERDRGVLS